jgi:hypothetical protein
MAAVIVETKTTIKRIECLPQFSTKRIPSSTRRYAANNLLVVGVSIYNSDSVVGIGMYSENGHTLALNHVKPSHVSGSPSNMIENLIKKEKNADREDAMKAAIDLYLGNVIRIDDSKTTTNRGILFVAYGGIDHVFLNLMHYVMSSKFWRDRRLYACDLSDLYMFCSGITRPRYPKYEMKEDPNRPKDHTLFASMYGMVFNQLLSMDVTPLALAQETLRLALRMAMRLSVNKHASESADDAIWSAWERKGQYTEPALLFKTFCYETIHELGQTIRRIPADASGFVLPGVYFNHSIPAIETNTTGHALWASKLIAPTLAFFTGLSMLIRSYPTLSTRQDGVPGDIMKSYTDRYISRS